MTWPCIVLWLLIGFGLYSRGPLLLYLFSATIIFGGLTMLPLGLTGGLNLPAQTICAALLVGKMLLNSESRAAMLNLALDARQMGALAAFLVYAALTAVILPRLFGGEVLLYSLNAAGSKSLLTTTSANFSQTIYIAISVGIAFCFAVASRTPGFLRHYSNAILATGSLLVLSGLADLLLSTSGHAALLNPFHNASYNLLTDESLDGQKRVVGLMPEASVYGEACCFILSYLVFNYGIFEAKFTRLLLPATVIALAVLTFLSTSSTGYVGLLIIGGIQPVRLVWHFLFREMPRGAGARQVLVMFTGLAALLLVFTAVVLSDLPYYTNLLNTVLFNKSSSGSYIERSSWTAAGIAAFVTTHGIGVGIGSIRTSNFFVNLLASTGIVGVALLLLFLLKLLWPFSGTLSAADKSFLTGLKLCLIPAAGMLAISGTTPDPGVWLMSICGMIYGVRFPRYLATRQNPSYAYAEGLR